MKQAIESINYFKSIFNTLKTLVNGFLNFFDAFPNWVLDIMIGTFAVLFFVGFLRIVKALVESFIAFLAGV